MKGGTERREYGCCYYSCHHWQYPPWFTGPAVTITHMSTLAGTLFVWLYPPFSPNGPLSVSSSSFLFIDACRLYRNAVLLQMSASSHPTYTHWLELATAACNIRGPKYYVTCQIYYAMDRVAWCNAVHRVVQWPWHAPWHNTRACSWILMISLLSCGTIKGAHPSLGDTQQQLSVSQHPPSNDGEQRNKSIISVYTNNLYYTVSLDCIYLVRAHKLSGLNSQTMFFLVHQGKK